MAKIIGNTVGVPNPQSDYNQNDSTKADYIKNRPILISDDKWIDNYVGAELGRNVDGMLIYKITPDNDESYMLFVTRFDGEIKQIKIVNGRIYKREWVNWNENDGHRWSEWEESYVANETMGEVLSHIEETYVTKESIGDIETTLNNIILPEDGTVVKEAWHAVSTDCDSAWNNIVETYARKDEVAPWDYLLEVEAIAKGATQGADYYSYTEMCEVFLRDTMGDTERLNYNVGQSIYIVALDIPDLWVKEYNPNAAVFPSDEYYNYETGGYDFESYIYDNVTSGNKTVEIGSYVLAPLETQKVNLTNYATKEEVGNIENALDEIIKIQNALIGGETA